MARPIFLWDVLVKCIFAILGIIFAVIFWLFAAFFLLLNLLIPWHRLWRYLGVWNLVTLRFIMRRRNLHDTSSLPTKASPPDPRTVCWDPQYRTTRTADGTFNDLQEPLMGSANSRLARNFPLKRLKELHESELTTLVERDAGQRYRKVLSPNPRQISQSLLTRDRFKPASSLNLFAAAWIQFQVHDWFNHRRRPPVQHRTYDANDNYLPPVPLDDQDTWPGRERGHNSMWIRRTERDEDIQLPPELDGLPVYRNTETHWWDGSQVYGSSLEKQLELRARDGSGKLRVEADRRLPSEPGRPGIDLTGFNDNWWAGLSLLHTLFALEHNAICAQLKKAYPDWQDERLFQTARLINATLIVKIHTVEWTPAILGHPTLLIGMRANWWGILTQRLTTLIGRLKVLRHVQEEISGIPASEQDHHAAPYSMTEEFAAVYRMHPLIPDDYRIYSLETDELKVDRKFDDLQGDKTRGFMNRVGFENIFYSFGVAHPGAITLRNFPRALQQFKRMKDQDHVFNPPEVLDLAAVDIMRDRERAIPRYNDFRRMLMLLPCISYKRLVGVPLVRWLSGLTNREIEERKAWARELQKRYPNKEHLDLMVGLYAEDRPKGFGVSDTAFRVFVLMAPRRLKSDRFITTDFNADVYTQIGMDWIEHNDFKSVLLRHYPSLAPALDDVKNGFTPWHRTERPSPDPVDLDPAAADPRPEMRRVSTFQMPIFGGAFIGWLIGAVVEASQPGRTPDHFLAPLFTETAAHEAAIGAIIGGFCLAVLYSISFIATRELTLREHVQTGAGWGAAIGWLLGAAFYVWTHDIMLVRLGEILVTAVGALATREAVVGALLGAIIGFVREQTVSQVGRGASIGWLVSIAWHLWGKHGKHALLAELKDIILTMVNALGTREAIIAAFIGATIGIKYAGRVRLRGLFTGAGLRQLWWRANYGILFGALIGGAVGMLVGVIMGLTGDPTSLLATIGIVFVSVIAGIAVCSVRDRLMRLDWRWAYGFLAGALIGGVALIWVLWLAGGSDSLGRTVYPTLDALTFHLVAGAFWLAIVGLVLWVGGWVTAAALCGWVIGAVAHLIFYHWEGLVLAASSAEAGTGAVIGGFVGLALAAFLIRDLGWSVVWGLRGGLMGGMFGAFYKLKLWQLERVGKLVAEALTSQPAYWSAVILALLVGAVWLVRGPEVTWILRRTFWNLFGWFKFVGNRPLNVTPPRRRWWWKPVVWLKFWADRRATAAKENGSRLEDFWRCLKGRLEYRLMRSKAAREIDDITNLPFRRKFQVPINNILVSGSIPPDERSRMKTFVYRIQVSLYSVFPPMQRWQRLQSPSKDQRLPPISADPGKAFRHAYGYLQRKALDPPDLPPEYEGSPDLGSLAVRGPYSAYLRMVSDSDLEPRLGWDLLDLHRFKTYPELYSLGVRVLFRVERDTGQRASRLVPYRIDYQPSEGALRIFHELDPSWQLAKKLALCAATTHQSLVRHFNWVHLASGEPLAIATRTCLSSDHPLCRLLWPHIYGTQQGNTVVTLGQMVKGGDFDSIFSFPHDEMCRLFDESFREFRLVINDPAEDATLRGVRGYMLNVGYETSQRNLEALFDVIHRHVQRYLLIYYLNDKSFVPDADLTRWLKDPCHHISPNDRRDLTDRDTRNWLKKLDELLPDHSAVPVNPTLADLARLIARFIYLVTVEHEKCGSFLWNYQLWTHRQPIRVYRNGRREPLDVYQRLVNANLNLNVRRRALMDDFSYLALDYAGKETFIQFQKDLVNLQETMDKEPWEVWKIYPKMLEANINA